MIKLLKDCEIGSNVRVYIENWGRFDSQYSKIFEKKDKHILVEKEDGSILKLTDTTPCQILTIRGV